MEKVTGIGGIFIKSREPAKLAQWYRDHLGVPGEGEMAMFMWRDPEQPEKTGSTIWSLFPSDSDYFETPVMINYRVANLDKMLEQLRQGGVTVLKSEDSDYGKFAWVKDPEGNRIELWEPKGE